MISFNNNTGELISYNFYTIVENTKILYIVVHIV